ncbi:MAG: type II secretion system F family protein [Candidatus Eremiobacteraeota bacterium]|nr:type II secretion system F family protein [Candidatus Eremiobacteraeota bacterium]
MTAQLYHYAARSQEGKQIKGSIEAESPASAVAHLRARALFVTNVEPASSARGFLSTVMAKAGRRNASRAVFFRSFASLIGAGISVKRALDALVAGDRDPTFGEVLASIASDVAGGAALSVAMERHPREFGRICVATIRAGEVGGTLDRALVTIADLEERGRALRKRIGAALAYPAVVSIAAAGLVTFLVTNTMPSFASMFAQMHTPLPLSTRMLIRASGLLSDPRLWVLLTASLAASTFVLRWAWRSETRFAFTMDSLRLHAPIVGSLSRNATVARFARTLGSLLGAGVDVLAALEAAAGVVSGCVYRRGLRDLVTSLQQGAPLGERLEATGLFDGIFLALARAGEESGTLDAMLLRLAEYYELEIETALSSLTSVLEPALMCILGAVIGAIVASIVLPLYSLIGEIR